MPMTPEVVAQLNQEVPTPFHAAMLEHCINLVDQSRRKMSAKYDEWDRHDETYRGWRLRDKEDEKAKERKEPEKMTVPITHSQVQTFIAFCYAVLFQREDFYELFAMEPEVERGAKIGQTLLSRDLSKNNFNGKVYQFLLDVARFGIGVFKCGWVEEKMMVLQDVPAPPPTDVLGVPVGTQTPTKQRVPVTKFQGNEIRNISPFHFFPDVRVPLADLQKGEFVASEEEVSYVQLRQYEFEGVAAGINFVKTLSQKTATEGRRHSRLSSVEITQTGEPISVGQSKGAAVLTEVQVKLIPAEFEIDAGTFLGPETYPVKYMVWIVNDQRIVRIEPLDYPHDEFTYQIGEFTPDLHHFVNEGLAGNIDQLQDVITWFINSHITSVRKVIQNQLVVDPQGVNMDDIRQRRPVIRLQPGSSRLGIERWVHQLNLQDVTAKHMEDADAVHQLVQVVSGINDNALGQFHTGRRSATEARNVSSGTASRLKMICSLLYYSAFEPLGRQMLANLRNGLTLDVYVKIFGLVRDPTAQSYFEFAKVNKSDLVGDYDFSIFDGTLPSEKFYTAEALQELFSMLVASPELAAFLGFDLRQLIYEILQLRGVRHPEKFTLAEQQRQLAVMQVMMMNGTVPGQNATQSNANGSNGAASNGGVRETRPSGQSLTA